MQLCEFGMLKPGRGGARAHTHTAFKHSLFLFYQTLKKCVARGFGLNSSSQGQLLLSFDDLLDTKPILEFLLYFFDFSKDILNNVLIKIKKKAG